MWAVTVPMTNEFPVIDGFLFDEEEDLIWPWDSDPMNIPDTMNIPAIGIVETHQTSESKTDIEPEPVKPDPQIEATFVTELVTYPDSQKMDPQNQIQPDSQLLEPQTTIEPSNEIQIEIYPEPGSNSEPQEERKRPNIVHWVRAQLNNPNMRGIVAWTDESNGLFKILNGAALAQKWGKFKQNPGMTYDKFS
jgi:hypothetical protein